MINLFVLLENPCFSSSGGRQVLTAFVTGSACIQGGETKAQGHREKKELRSGLARGHSVDLRGWDADVAAPIHASACFRPRGGFAGIPEAGCCYFR